MANKPKFIYLLKNISDSKIWLKGKGANNNIEWDNSGNDFYRSLVFTLDGHLLIHGLDIYNPATNLGCGILYNSSNGITSVNSGEGVPVFSATKTNNTITGQSVSFRGIKETFDGSLSENSFNLITEKAVRDAINASFAANNAMIYKGVYNAKAEPENNGTAVDLTGFSVQPNNLSLGWTWIVTGVNNTNKYFGNIEVENGDMIVANIGNPGTDISKYNVIQTNLVHALTEDVFKNTYKDLYAIENLSGSSGFLKKTAINTWSLYSITTPNTGGITILDQSNSLTISLKTAQIGEVGGVKVLNAIAQDGTNPTLENVSTTQNRYYGLQVNNEGVAFVNIPWVNTWRDIKAWRFSELGSENDTIDEIYTKDTVTSVDRALIFGLSFAAIQSALNGPYTIELIWADVASDGTITYHY